MIKGRCEDCKKEFRLYSGGHKYCIEHYIAHEPEECLFEDLRIVFLTGNFTNFKQSEIELLVHEIKKRYPEIYQDAKDEFLGR